MKFMTALRSVISSDAMAVRQPEMAGYVRTDVQDRTMVPTIVSASGVGSLVGGVGGTHVFEHSGSGWTLGGSSVSLSGAISVSGTPMKGDSFSVQYAPEGPSASVTSSNVSGVRTVVITFKYLKSEWWGTAMTDDPAITCTVDTSNDSILSVNGITSAPVGAFCLNTKMLSGFLEDDWFTSSAEDAERARTTTY